MRFAIEIILAATLLTALILMLTRRYPRQQMWAAMSLITLLAIVIIDLQDHWAFIEWAVRESFSLLRLWLTR